MENLIASDLILLVLAAPSPDPRTRDRISGITRLEKLLFLLEKETDASKAVSEPFEFAPYNFGPYSKEVYDSIELLESIGLIKEERVLADSPLDLVEERALGAPEEHDEGTYERRFVLTDEGKSVSGVLFKHVGEKLQRQLEQVKEKYGTIPLGQLIRYVYKRYPEYAEKSVIRGHYF